MLINELTLTRWSEVYPAFEHNPFENLANFLYGLGFDTSEAGLQNLYDDFNWSYADALCYFQAETDVNRIFKMILLDAKKYNLASKMWGATKTEDRLRSPLLTTTTHGSANGSSSVERKQVETRTEKPLQNFGTERTHKVNPYDNPGFVNEYQDDIKYTGSREFETKYTGDPDKSTSTSSANSSTTETGTDRTEITTIGNDRITVAEQIEGIEAVNTLWQMIKADLATKLFMQVWR